MSNDLNPINGEYTPFLHDLKFQIETAQTRAIFAVNHELILLYWKIGREIAEKQNLHGWGDKILDRLANDLKTAFPGVEGFSRRSLYRMKAFYLAYPNEAEFVSQVATQIPWYHNVVIIERIKDPQTRIWYAQKTLEYGWSRTILEMQIASKLHERQGNTITNFAKTLPKPQSDLAQELLKDPYNFDFLTLHQEAVERDLEKGLLTHIQKFLLELGAGFSFVGSQYHIEVGTQSYYIDLLFFHLTLRCYVVIDLKMGEFQPEFAGKMNFYLSAVDDQLRHSTDNPSIGIILCKTRDRVIAEYALRGMSQPMGVAEFLNTIELPKELQGSLPTIAQLEAEFSNSSVPNLEQ